MLVSYSSSTISSPASRRWRTSRWSPKSPSIRWIPRRRWAWSGSATVSITFRRSFREASSNGWQSTGLNNTQPARVTGAIAPGAAPLAVQAELQVGSTGFGQGEITYAGAAPGFVAGLTQINFRLPASIFHGFTDLYLSMSDSFISQTGVYFYLQ